MDSYNFKETNSQRENLYPQPHKEGFHKFNDLQVLGFAFRLHVGLYIIVNILMLLAAIELTFQPLPFLLLWPLAWGIGLYFHYSIIRVIKTSSLTQNAETNSVEKPFAKNLWPPA